MAWRLLAALLVCWAAPARGAGEDYATLYRETRQFLKDIVRLNTSNPPGNEIMVANYLKMELDRENIPSKIYISTGTRASLIARLKGNGAKRPLILMCHTDVVPADPKEWDTDPFTPVEKDGYLYGRGTADIKSMCAAEAAILLRLSRAHTPLARDVVFFAEADEETGEKERHIGWLLQNHGDALDGEFGINEGGQTVWKDAEISEVRIQAAEKAYLDVTLKAHGHAGHASIPQPNQAVLALARAVSRLGDHRFAAQVNDVVRGFLEKRMGLENPQVSAAIREVLDAKPGATLDQAADKLAALSPEFGAMLRDTLNPTIFKAGYKSNVVPSEAEAVLNARLMPGRNPEDFRKELASVIQDSSIEISFPPQSRPPMSPMPTNSDLYRAAQSAAAELMPQARVTPFMSAWTTDCADMRARSVLMYGIDPPLTEEDDSRVHGANERLSLDALDAYTRYLLEIVLKLAAA